MLNIGFLSSHSGSNVQAIIDKCESGELNAKVGVIISNNSNAFVLQRGKNHSIPTYHISGKEFPSFEDETNQIISILQKHNVEVLVLAGYMKKISSKLIKTFNGKVLNIHPSLLPKYGGRGMFGMKVHEQVVLDKAKETGATVHLVDDEYDRGRILIQEKIELTGNETVEEVAQKVLKIEHKIYSETLNKIEKGLIKI